MFPGSFWCCASLGLYLVRRLRDRFDELLEKGQFSHFHGRNENRPVEILVAAFARCLRQKQAGVASGTVQRQTVTAWVMFCAKRIGRAKPHVLQGLIEMSSKGLW